MLAKTFQGITTPDAAQEVKHASTRASSAAAAAMSSGVSIVGPARTQKPKIKLVQSRGLKLFDMIETTVTTACAKRTGSAASVARRRREPARAILLVRSSVRPPSACIHFLFESTSTSSTESTRKGCSKHVCKIL